MKFIRKIVTLVITVIFVAALAIGTGVIFSVKNINVTLLSYEYGEGSSGADEKITVFKEKLLNEYKGTVISFVNQDDVLPYVEDGYYLDGFEKIYPCTINVTIRQRMDIFALYNGENYSIFDESGKFLFTSDSYINSIDEAPNTLIEGAEGSSEIEEVAGVCSLFKERFLSLRSSVDKVVLEKAHTTLAKDKLSFVLRCGITIELQDYSNYTAKKIEESYREFSSLTGEQKLRGTIYCFEDADGNIVKTYNQFA